MQLTIVFLTVEAYQNDCGHDLVQVYRETYSQRDGTNLVVFIVGMGTRLVYHMLAFLTVQY